MGLLAAGGLLTGLLAIYRRDGLINVLDPSKVFIISLINVPFLFFTVLSVFFLGKQSKLDHMCSGVGQHELHENS